MFKFYLDNAENSIHYVTFLACICFHGPNFKRLYLLMLKCYILRMFVILILAVFCSFVSPKH